MSCGRRTALCWLSSGNRHRREMMMMLCALMVMSSEMQPRRRQPARSEFMRGGCGGWQGQFRTTRARLLLHCRPESSGRAAAANGVPLWRRAESLRRLRRAQLDARHNLYECKFSLFFRRRDARSFLAPEERLESIRLAANRLQIHAHTNSCVPPGRRAQQSQRARAPATRCTRTHRVRRGRFRRRVSGRAHANQRLGAAKCSQLFCSSAGCPLRPADGWVYCVAAAAHFDTSQRRQT